jgi:glycosyltransferase involved in cell wall biosynthesis
LKDWISTLSYERHAFRHARICNVVSEADRDAVLQVLPRLEVSVVHNGVDSEYFAPMPGLEEPATLVFEGAMSFGPNRAAAVWFCSHVLPLVLAAEPRARLLIVGRDPAPDVQALAGPAVEVTGFVDDVRPYLARGAVFVAPLVSGAGIKNKILQAWAMARAVVGTTLATGGLRVEPGVNALVADRPEDFCAACVRLFADPRERAALGAAGRATVVEHYSWEAKSRELEAALERAAR